MCSTTEQHDDPAGSNGVAELLLGCADREVGDAVVIQVTDAEVGTEPLALPALSGSE